MKILVIEDEIRDFDLDHSGYPACRRTRFEAFDASPAKCPVIFTTGYGEYAVKAFGYNGTGYLLKPVDRQELAKAIDKAVRQHGTEGNLHYRHRFLVSEKDGYLVIDVGTVSYIYSEGRLTSLKQWMDT